MSHPPARSAKEDTPLSDEELLALLQEAEEAKALVDEVKEAAPEPEAEPPLAEEPEGDPCPGCGEPTKRLERCIACGMQGCLPRDDWQPGWRDPCLTRCERCALLVHTFCATPPDDDFNVNPRCHLCAGRY